VAEFEVDESSAAAILQDFLAQEGEQEEDSGELQERVATKKFTGHLVLKGFDDKTVASISDEIKFRVQAVRFGERVRVIIDMKV